MSKQELIEAIAAKRAEIDAKKEEIESFEPDPDDSEAAFMEMLDECYDEIKIGCCAFSPSRVLKGLDPIAFNCGLNEWVDCEFTENPDNFVAYVNLRGDLDGLEAELLELESELEELEEDEA